MKKHAFVLLFFLSVLYGGAQEGYKFRIQLKDKGETGFSIGHPEEYLSQRSIDRRKRQKIDINESDLPVSPDYIRIIENLNCKVVAKSKWVKTISIHCEDSSIVAKIRELDFVKKADCVWIDSYASQFLKEPKEIKNTARTIFDMPSTYYGYGWEQVKTVNGQFLHQEGYKGEGIQIAVIDGGFEGLENNVLSSNMNVLGTKDFVYETGGEVQHGFDVLSLMASNTPNLYVGTAPSADYWLLRTEDERGETPIEEDYWITALEYADSIGVDLVNSSLGYYRFDHPFENHLLSELDGKTALISQAAEMAAQKGIFVVNSAGNERIFDWKKIVFPADAEHVLSVGSINSDSIPSSFSSIGPPVGRYTKPDLSVLGDNISFIADDQTIYKSSGTSYSSPIVCGLVACLWEAFPQLTSHELLDIMRQSCHQYSNPDKYWGYGIPDMEKAYTLALKGTSGIEDDAANKDGDLKIYSLGNGYIRVENKSYDQPCNITVYTLDGKTILRRKITEYQEDIYIPTKNETLICTIWSKDINYSVKIYLR